MDEAERRRGRKLAQWRYLMPPGQVCAECEVAPAEDRHHWDGNPRNNDATNIVFTCEACHVRLHHDHRVRARRWVAQKSVKTHCVNGHLFDDANTYVAPSGRRMCRACCEAWRVKYRSRRTELRHLLSELP